MFIITGVEPRWDLQTHEQILPWAIARAASIHIDQVDKGGQPYILHPMRVMMAMETIEEKIVAVLHDVVEDGNVYESELKDHIGGYLTRAVMAISRQKGETYSVFIKRVKQNDIARKVKIADLKDNMDRSRIPNPTKADERRWEKYAKALAELSG